MVVKKYLLCKVKDLVKDSKHRHYLDKLFTIRLILKFGISISDLFVGYGRLKYSKELQNIKGVLLSQNRPPLNLPRQGRL
jgi:hypothetical protein